MSLSKWQYGMLKYIDTHDVVLEDLQTVNGGTLGSLLASQTHPDYIHRTQGSGIRIRIELTNAGREAIAAYDTAGPRKRLHSGPITDRCARALRVTRVVRKLWLVEKNKAGANHPATDRKAS
jgi:hypothetical protein